MKKTTQTFLSVLAILVLSVPMVFAQQGQDRRNLEGRQGFHGQSWQMPWQQPLTQEQQQAVQQVYETKVTQVYPLNMRIKAVRAELVAELHSEQVDQGAVDQLVSRLSDLRTELVRQQIDMFLQLKRADVPVHMLPGMMQGMMGGMGMGRGKGMRGMGMMGGHGM
ncbi:MAG: periplasmic heavy metal sensor, partial [Desulfovibrionales bacterium]